jgi:hypothetical protein
MSGGGNLVGPTRLGVVVLTAVSMTWLTGALPVGAAEGELPDRRQFSSARSGELEPPTF